MKKGFTLIELLAVIIILAVIVVIVVPMVSDIIIDSEVKTNITSIEMYGRALSQAALNYEINEKKKASSYEEIKKYIKYTGDNIECSVISIEGSDIFLDRCSVDGQKIEKYYYGKSNKCELLSGNPNEIGSKYECEVKPGVKYIFFVLSYEADDSTNLIMERNICEDGTVATSENKCVVAWYSEENRSSNEYGPVTAMNYLYNITSSWNFIPNLELNYRDEGNCYGSIITTDNITKFESGANVLGNKEGYINLKARMPYSREIVSYNSINKTYAFLYDYLNLKDNIQLNPVDGLDGYWTMSSVDTGDCSYYNYVATYVSKDGALSSINIYDYYFGIRPIINVRLK